MERIEYHYENKLILHSSVRYVFPPMLGMIFAQVAPLVDAVCVSGTMGTEALAALSTVAPLFYAVNMISALGGIGVGVMISKCSGAGEKEKAARVFTRGLAFMTAATLLTTLAVFLFMDPLLRLLQATPENYGYAREYLTVVLPGAIFMVLNFAGDYILANDNNQNLAVAGDITGAVVNVIVDFVGVYVFHFGIWVVAFGTVFGSICCFLVYLMHFRKKDRLCRITALRREEGDPGLWEILKAGSAEALMYVMLAAELLFQNFVLREGAGTSGLGNSAVIENFQLVITIIIAGATDAIYPMVAAYSGEQNKCAMLMVKRMLTRIGFAMLLPILALFFVFPQLMIMPYRISDPAMLASLPFAIRLNCINSLVGFLGALLVDYLSATDDEARANLSYAVQYAVQFPVTYLLSRRIPLDAPWYAQIAASVAVLIYLCFFCGSLPRGMSLFHRENLLLLTGGKLSPDRVREWKRDMASVLERDDAERVERTMLAPLLAVLPEDRSPEASFTVLDREDGRKAAILRYASKKDYLEGNADMPEQDVETEEEEGLKPEVLPGVCIRSEFLGHRRLMIVL